VRAAAQPTGIQRSVTALTGRGPATKVCRQVATMLDRTEALLLR
jgi:hypothetical protein